MISVIVPTYNEEKNIERCLNAIANQSIPRENIEIIVVDGNSHDNTQELAAKIADTVLVQKSQGVGGARNDGFEIAKYEIVATTDADCEPYERWLESILAKFEDENVVAVTGVLKPFDWGEMNKLEVMLYQALFDASNIILVISSKFGHYHLCGANSAFKKAIIKELGGYLPLAYGDDVEIFKRIKNKGKVLLSRGMKIKYSVRRIKKIGLMNYCYLLLKMDTEIMLLGRQPMKGNYSRMNYD